MSEGTKVIAPEPGPAGTGQTVRSSGKGRSIAIVVMLVVAALLTTPALVAYWGQRTLNDTDRYVETTRPLVQSPEVQAAITTRVTDALEKQVDVEALLTEAFSGVIADRPRIQLLIGPIAGAVNGLIASQVQSFVASDAFEDIWVQVNTRTQQLLVKVLNGEDTGAVSVQDDQIVLDVSDVIDAVKARLVERGLTFADKIPLGNTDRQIVLLTSPQLKQAQNIYALTNPVAKWLLWVVLAMYLLVVILAARRPRMTVWVGVALLVNGLLIAWALSIGRQVFINQLQGTVFGPASRVFYDDLLHYLASAGRAVVTLGVILLLVGWFASGVSTAVAARRVTVNGLETVGAAIQIDQVRSFGKWVAANLGWLRIAIAALGFVVAFVGDRVDRERLLWSFLLVVVLLALAQVLAGAGKAGPVEKRPIEEPVPA